MYVRWKVLIALGTALWLLLCLLDYFPINHIDHLILQKQQHVDIETIKLVSPYIKTLKQVNKYIDEGNLGIIKVVLWNLVAFASTITVCFALKTISSKLNIINNQAYLLDRQDKTAVKKTSSSRIPIPITSKSSSTDIHIEGARINADELREAEYNKSCPNLSRSHDLEEKMKLECKGDKKFWSIKIMEKHCAKLREEMINLQAASIKEQTLVSKKMDTLTKEKRELIKLYNSLTKENKTLKMQIDEMIGERTLLIKRLECATKEMRNATKNKRVTVAKLDEAMTNAETLKLNLERIKKDKTALEDKLIRLDAEYKRLKGEVELYKPNEAGMEKRFTSRRATVTSDPFKKLDSIMTHVEDEDLNAAIQTDQGTNSNSDDDIKKVQQKLLKLEKSLENFKLRHTLPEEPPIGDSTAISKSKPTSRGNSGATPTETPRKIPLEGGLGDESSVTTKTDDTEEPTVCIYSEEDSKASLQKEPSSASICTETDCPLEHKECNRAECFLRRKMLEVEDISSSGEDVRPTINYHDYVNVKKKIVKVKSSISDDRLSVISELGASTADESGDDWSEPKRRFVTHSPAFQKFLREALDTQTLSKVNLL